ncbi:hypothetical protein NPX13_g2105 [Xylaria arbuscula]|uniref:Uncharacterized protein n=1 Tax=Xylaria arbuscula TaxID=114810 RepID=A0A9W8NKU2_9PEZI|nr:hypothetical protein NPX13_g2105 [Xylaria arbuscula]
MLYGLFCGKETGSAWEQAVLSCFSAIIYLGAKSWLRRSFSLKPRLVRAYDPYSELQEPPDSVQHKIMFMGDTKMRSKSLREIVGWGPTTWGVNTIGPTKELSTIPFDSDTASELQRPAATFETHGLTFDTAPLNRRIDNQAELDACLQNVVRIARHLRQQAEERQMNMPRLYAEFITAFLTQRQQLEMIFVHTRVALREGRVPDAAWTQAMQVMTWKTRSSEASQADLHTLVNRAALPFLNGPGQRAVTTKHPTITVSDFISDGQSTTYTSQMLLSASVKAMKYGFQERIKDNKAIPVGVPESFFEANTAKEWRVLPKTVRVSGGESRLRDISEPVLVVKAAADGAAAWQPLRDVLPLHPAPSKIDD